MKKQRSKLFVLLAAVISIAPLDLLGSGSYCACLPKPPSKTAMGARLDRDKYDFGQKVFAGRTAPAQGDPAAQRLKLEALQARLPRKVAKEKDLTALSGKLTEQQLQALEYFVDQRYPQPK